MRRCAYWLLFGLFGWWQSAPLHAQITLNANHFQTLIGKAYASTIYNVNFGNTQDEQAQTRLALQSLIRKNGPSQTWDFTTLSYQQPTTFSIPYLPYDNTLPGAAAFTQADHAVLLRAYIYGSLLQDDGNYYYGLATGDSTLVLDEPFLNLKFPLTEGVSWQWPSTPSTDLEAIARFLTAITGDSTAIQTYEQYRDQLQGATVQIFWEVDGYGTLTTPAGSRETLRLKRTVRVSGVSGFSQPLDIFISYIWLSADWLQSNPAEIIQAEIVTTLTVSQGFPPVLTQVPSGAYYSVATLRPVAGEPLPQTPTVRLWGPYPNPAAGQTTLTLHLSAPQSITVRVYNLLGQEIARPFEGMLPAGTHPLSIPTRTWPTGLYLCRVETPGQSWTRRLVVMH
ncbi:T9SS type A sorting domain-containing protein [Rhodothermus profundi]|uniref:Por secretion system C-terminal sorting domain-containing protein n=1 Tax=Rhodothermus profundi TaxID=633813 RepID=A0A1M6P8P6_9BACT|nr:T9SS type A sorting domain-containing protein [Rhodothermus profundi]SHK04286.1 Por secretion system C-terminal sorting domain-containing protein [Rhodothermus profundi]